jgi:hypothetical protein
MVYSQKWTLVCFLEPIDKNTQFSYKEWPLHATIACAGAFYIPLNSEDFITKLKPTISNFGPIRTKAINIDQFGVHNVTLLDKTKELAYLHLSIINLIERLGGNCSKPEYILENYRPHCTFQKSGYIEPGTDIILNSVSLVDMFPGNNPFIRKVSHNLNLNDNLT